EPLSGLGRGRLGRSRRHPPEMHLAPAAGAQFLGHERGRTGNRRRQATTALAWRCARQSRSERRSARLVRRDVLPCLSAIQACRAASTEGPRSGPDLRALCRGVLTCECPKRPTASSRRTIRRPGLDSSIPAVSELTAIPGNEGLSPAEREARQREIFQPYHARIEQLLESRSASGRRTLLIAMHSFTPVFKSVARKVDVGVLYNRDARLPYIMLDLLRHEGDLNVGDNQPYAVGDLSDYTVPVHGEQRGLPH